MKNKHKCVKMTEKVAKEVWDRTVANLGCTCVGDCGPNYVCASRSSEEIQVRLNI